MKKIVLAFIAIVPFISFVHAQSDTLYIMKAGVVVDKYDVNNHIDSIIFYPPPISNKIIDYDGNVYNTVTIGSQVWMAENLKTTHYADGTAIPLVSTIATWDSLTSTSKAYCWYNDDIANKATYGALYTWPAAMNGKASSEINPSFIQGVCPAGWHLPSFAEWVQLEKYLAKNGYNYDGTDAQYGREGAKLAKSLASTSGWESSSVPGSAGSTDYPAYRNKSSFTALPSGYRYKSGNFYDFGIYGGWWSATIDFWGNKKVSIYSIYYNVSYVSHGTKEEEEGLSVRCVKD